MEHHWSMFLPAILSGHGALHRSMLQLKYLYIYFTSVGHKRSLVPHFGQLKDIYHHIIILYVHMYISISIKYECRNSDRYNKTSIARIQLSIGQQSI